MSEREDPFVVISRHRGAEPKVAEPEHCSPKTYVSNEEAAVAEAMRRLRSQAEAVREQLESCAAEQRPALKQRLEQLRDEWRELAQRRDAANIRKLIMLGHLPPDAESL